jgi:hypothetical protein
MPYFINTWRTPKAGRYMEVAKAAGEALKATGKPGFVNLTLSPPRPTDTSMRVIGTIGGFDTLTDIENFFDALLEDETRFASVEKVNILCNQSNVSVSKILNPSSTWPDGFTPKFVKRDFITPVGGALPELIDLLIDWSQEATSRIHWVISQTVRGLSLAETLRVSHFSENLQTLEDFDSNDIMPNHRLKRFGELVASAPVRGTGRITYINRP